MRTLTQVVLEGLGLKIKSFFNESGAHGINILVRKVRIVRAEKTFFKVKIERIIYE